MQVRAYLDVLDTAQWLRDWLRGQLAGFELDLLGLRVLEMLYRDGPMEVGRGAFAKASAGSAPLFAAASARGGTFRRKIRLSSYPMD